VSALDLLYSLPGLAAGGAALWHSARTRRYWHDKIESSANELQRQIMDQYMHGLQLWPRPWARTNDVMTQVEQIVREPYGFKGMPYPPEQQREQMQADAQRILDSYKLRLPEDGDDA